MRKKKERSIFYILFILALVHTNGFSQESQEARGDLTGCIYAKNGVTPVENATLLLKKLPGGRIYTSGPSDQEGMFKIRNLEKGVYIFGVRTSRGDYDGRQLFGILISESRTARVAIVLGPQKEKDEKIRFVPLLQDSVGQASILAGNPSIVTGIAVIGDEPREAGPFRRRSPRP